MVTHALQFIDDELDGDEFAQVARDRRLEAITAMQRLRMLRWNSLTSPSLDTISVARTVSRWLSACIARATSRSTSAAI